MGEIKILIGTSQRHGQSSRELTSLDGDRYISSVYLIEGMPVEDKDAILDAFVATIRAEIKTRIK